MDPVTHALAGVVVGQLFNADGVGLAVAAAGALAPDAEFLTRKIPRTAFLDYHHGLVHTLPGGFIAGVIIAAAGAILAGRDFLPLLPIAWAAIGSHIVLDLLIHNNGIALLAPFNRRRYSCPVVLGLNPVTASPHCRERRYGTCLLCQANGMRFNPFFWVLLAAVAARLAFPRGGRAAGWVAVALLAGFSLYSGRRRIKALAVAEDKEAVLRRKAFPAAFNLNRWLVLQEDAERYHAALVDVREARPIWERTIAKGSPPPPVIASERLLSVRGFKNSVMFPHWRCRRVDGLDQVAWSDLSYLFSDAVELYALHVRMTGDGAIVQNEFNERW